MSLAAVEQRPALLQAYPKLGALSLRAPPCETPWALSQPVICQPADQTRADEGGSPWEITSLPAVAPKPTTKTETGGDTGLEDSFSLLPPRHWKYYIACRFHGGFAAACLFTVLSALTISKTNTSITYQLIC